MDYDLKYISWYEAKETNEYHYTGDKNSPNEIANIFQELATTKNDERRSIISLHYHDYICELDIFWEETEFESNELGLVIQLFIDYDDNTINCSMPLLISNIYKPDYLEKEMYGFILESI